MKAYINYRTIPAGYVNDVLQSGAAAIDPVSKFAWEYLNCGDTDDTTDFFGANMFSVWEDSTYFDPGYSNATQRTLGLLHPRFPRCIQLL